MNKNEKWDLSVSHKHNLFDFRFHEVIRYRELIFTFFWRDFVTVYKQTILGPLWYIISPLCSTVVYSFAFGSIAGMGTDGIPALLFYFAGTMLWTYFSTCLNNASQIFISNSKVFGKVYFPRLTVPIATTLSSMIKLMIQFIMLMGFLVYHIYIGSSVRPSFFAFLFPLLIIWIGVLGTGLGMIFSALTIKYRDLKHLLALAVQLAMYITPVVYPLSQIPEKFKFFFHINPMSAPMEIFRIWFFGEGYVPIEMILISFGITILVVFTGLILFNKTARTFLDVI